MSDVFKAIFEDLGGVTALSKEHAEYSEGPLVGHLQRVHIQLSAISVFVEKGLADTSVNDLLEAAQISRRTFYKYFANKMEVLESIYASSITLLVARFRQMQQDLSLSEWLHAVVALFLDYHIAVGPIIRLMQEEAMRADSTLAPHRQRAHAELLGLFLQRLDSIQISPQPAIYYQALLWTLETTSLNLLTGNHSHAAIEQAKTALGNLLCHALGLPSNAA